jgi:hypothetical protein
MYWLGQCLATLICVNLSNGNASSVRGMTGGKEEPVRSIYMAQHERRVPLLARPAVQCPFPCSWNSTRGRAGEIR